MASFSEVIAEGEVAEHLEEGEVAGGYLFHVVAFAAGAHAFLGGAGAKVVALLAAKKNILELVHSRVGKQQRRIVSGNERR